MSKIYEVTRVIVGGRTPHVRFHTVRYTNERLRKRRDLVREKVVLTIDPDDMRSVDARFKNGHRLGTLKMIGTPINAPISLDELDRAVRDFKRQK